MTIGCLPGRELLERYVGGPSALLPDAQAESDRLVEQVERLWGIAEKLVSPVLDKDQSCIADAEARHDERVASRVQWLADDA